MVYVKVNTGCVHIKRRASEENAWESDTYIRVWQVQMEYLSGKPPYDEKMVDKP